MSILWLIIGLLGLGFLLLGISIDRISKTKDDDKDNLAWMIPLMGS